MTDWKEHVLILFLLGFLGIPILCLFSIPISLFMGLPWYNLALTVLWDIFSGLLLIVLIIIAVISGSTRDWGDRNELINAGIGLLLFLLSAGIAFGIWTLGDEVWKLWGKRICESKKRKKALAWELEDQLKELKEQLSEGVITQEEYRETLQSQLRELDEQLYYCAITEEEYEQKKKELLEKSEA